MPYIHVSSNVAAAGIDTDAFARALSKSLAGSLGAPEQLLLAKLSLGSPMLMAKKSDPCAFVEIRSAQLDPKKNPAIVKAVTETVTATLGVSPKRIFVNLQEIPPTHWGFNGATAASRL
ncbi:hypothetical protein PybrP1_001843 [[Pythium] brassicae (nom. inval.)]|nr:hypothetical protein PybrP1_001843 [[Pythium] brassicae (nom. inval.)]